MKNKEELQPNEQSQSQITSTTSYFQEQFKGQSTNNVDFNLSNYQDMEQQIISMRYEKLKIQSLGFQTVYDQRKLKIEAKFDQIKISALEKHDSDNVNLKQQNEKLKEENQHLKDQLQKVNQQINRFIELQLDHEKIQIYKFQSARHQQIVNQLEEKNTFLRQEISNFKNQVESYQNQIKSISNNQNQQLQKHVSQQIRQISQIPVYIEKEIIIEVPVPIYINDKERKLSSQNKKEAIMQSIGFSSVDCQGESIEVFQKQMNINQQGKKHQFGLGDLCRSIKDSLCEEQIEDFNQANIQKNREIVEVPVYIEKEVQIVKEVIIEKEVIKLVYADKPIIVQTQSKDYLISNEHIKEEVQSKNTIGQLLIDTPKKQNKEEVQIFPSAMDLQLLGDSNVAAKRKVQNHFQTFGEPIVKPTELQNIPQKQKEQTSSKSEETPKGNKLNFRMTESIVKSTNSKHSQPSQQREELEKDVLPLNASQFIREVQLLEKNSKKMFNQKFVIIEYPTEIIIEKIVQKQVEKQYVVEVPIEIQKVVIKQIPINVVQIIEMPVLIQIPVQKIVEIQKIVFIEMPQEIILQRVVEVEKLIEVPIEKIVEKVLTVEIPTQITLEKIIQTQKIVEMEKMVQVQKIVMVEIQKIVTIDIPIQIVCQKLVDVQRIITQQVPIQVQKVVEKIVQIEIDKIIEVQKIFEEEKEIIIEVPTQIMIERVVKQYIEVEKIVEKIVQVEKIIQVATEIQIIVEKQIPIYIDRVEEVQIPIYIEVEKEIEKIVKDTEIIEKISTVEVPTQIIIEVIKQKLIEKQIIKQIPIEIIKQVFVEREKIIEVIKQVPLQVQIRVQVEKIVEVQIEKIVQIIKEVTVIEERQIIKEVIIQKPIFIQKQNQKQQLFIQEPQLTTVSQINSHKIEQKTYQQQQKLIDQHQNVVEKIIEYPVEIIIEVIKEVIIEKIVEIQKQMIVQTPVEIINQKIVYVEKIVEKQVPIEVIKYSPVQIETQKIIQKQVIIEKPIYIQKDVIVEKIVEVIKEVIVQKTVQVIRQIQVETSKSQKTDQIEIQNRFDSKQFQNILQDRDEIPFEAQRPAFEFATQEIQMKEKTQNELEEMISSYQQNQKRLQQQLKYISEQFGFVSQQRNKIQQKLQQSERQIIDMTQFIKEQENTIRSLSFAKKQQNSYPELQKRYKQEKNKKITLQAQVKTITSELNITKSQMKQLQLQLFDQVEKYKSLQKLKEDEALYLEKIIKDKNDQLQQVSQANYELQEYSRSLEIQKQDIIKGKVLVEDELIDLKQEIDDKEKNQIENNIQGSIDQLKYKELLEDTEKIYKQQIEELIKKNYTNISQKNAEIQELQKIIKMLEQQLNHQRENQPNIPTKHDKNIHKANNQNQRLQKIIQSLNIEIKSLKNATDIQKKANPQTLGKAYSFSQHDRQNSPVVGKTKIRIQQITQKGEQYQDQYNRMNKLINQYMQEIQRKDSEINRMKNLMYDYQNVIEDMKKQRGSPYSFKNTHSSIEYQQQSQRGSYSDPKIQLDTNIYVSNLLRKVNLCEEQLKFQRNQKVKQNIKIRQMERIIEEFHYKYSHENQDPEQDSQLLEKVVFELERQRNYNEQLRDENNFLNHEITKHRIEIQLLKNNSNIIKNYSSNSRLYEEEFDDLDEDLEADFYDNQTLIKQIKYIKGKYSKLLDMIKLIKQQIRKLEGKVPRPLIQHLESIKKWINNIQSLSRVVPSKSKKSRQAQRKSTNQLTKFEKEKYKYQQNGCLYPEEDDNVFKEIKQVDASIEYEDEQPQITLKLDQGRQKQASNRFIDLSLENLIQKNIPNEMKYLVSLKLIQFGIELSTSNNFDSLCPQKILVMHYNPISPQNMKLNLSTIPKSKDKVRLYQAPEVLIGQPQSEKSYAWSIGIIIDKLFHGRLYYEKFADILSSKNNYEFEDLQSQDIAQILTQMVVKNKEERIILERAYGELVDLLQSM